MKKLPTAAEFFENGNFNNVTDMLIEFSKIHVETALKEASKKVKRREGLIVDHKLTKSMLNTYPLDNIK